MIHLLQVSGTVEGSAVVDVAANTERIVFSAHACEAAFRA